jgi:hypothetical protein
MVESFPEQSSTLMYIHDCREVGIDVTSDYFINWMVNDDIERANLAPPPLNQSMSMALQVRRYLHANLSSYNFISFLSNPAELKTIDDDIETIVKAMYDESGNSKIDFHFDMNISNSMIYPSEYRAKILRMLTIETSTMLYSHLSSVFMQSGLASHLAETLSLKQLNYILF